MAKRKDDMTRGEQNASEFDELLKAQEEKQAELAPDPEEVDVPQERKTAESVDNADQEPKAVQDLPVIEEVRQEVAESGLVPEDDNFPKDDDDDDEEDEEARSADDSDDDDK